MTRKYAIAALSVAMLAVGAVALNGRASHPPQPQPSPQQSRRIPDHVTYRMLLHNVYLFNQKAEANELQGKRESAGAFRRAFQHEAELSDEQARMLNEIAADCEREVREQDAKARVIIDARRAAYPGGRIPPGGKPLPPSPELEAMQQERNAIILRARDRLRQALGEQEWGRFQEFIHQRVASNITITPASPGQPVAAISSDAEQEPRGGVK
jgi:hypothetical protein